MQGQFQYTKRFDITVGNNNIEVADSLVHLTLRGCFVKTRNKEKILDAQQLFGPSNKTIIIGLAI